MTDNELVAQLERIEKEFDELKESFRALCSSDYVDYNYCVDIYGPPEELFLDVEMNDEVKAEIQRTFWFYNGAARRRFDLFRVRGALLSQLRLTVFDEMYGREEVRYDGYENPRTRWSREDIIRLKRESEAVIAEEKAFVELAEEALMILEVVQKEK